MHKHQKTGHQGPSLRSDNTVREKRRKGKGRERKGRERKGREGKGREGKGQEGRKKGHDKIWAITSLYFRN